MSPSRGAEWPELRRVRKRDGTDVPFDKQKVANAVLAAQVAVGEEDDGLAGQVAELVELALGRYLCATRTARGDEGVFADSEPGGVPPEALPEIEEIQDLVEKALIEMGRAAVAKAYILYRDRRARAREALSVRPAPSQRRVLRALRVREAGGSFPWSKGRIIAALVNEAELSRSVAEKIAARVEVRVFSSGLKRISTGLIRELVDNELVGMGLDQALARHEPVALPRHDLRRLLENPPPPPRAEEPGPARIPRGERLGDESVDGHVAGEILKRYALDDVLAERIAERHLAGDLYVEDVTRPHLYLHQALPIGLFGRGRGGVRGAFEALDELASLSASTSRGVVLEGFVPLLSPLLRASRSDVHSPLASWLASLRALIHASSRRIDLSSTNTRAPALVVRLIEELAAMEAEAPGAPLPRLMLDRSDVRAALSHSPLLRGAVERLLATHVLLPTWSREGELFAGPGCHRRGREQGALACGGAVSINLARLARRAGPWREDLMLESCAELVEECVVALSGLAAFQRDVRAARSGEARGRVGYALTPVGLRESLRSLGDGELRPEQGARILGLLSEAARRFSAQRGLSVVLTPFFGGRAARRFARTDGDGPRVSQRLLFGEPDPSERGQRRPYTCGFDLGAQLAGQAGRQASTLLATVPTGAWIAGEVSGSDDDARLRAWERFDSSRAKVGELPPGAGDSEAVGLFHTP